MERREQTPTSQRGFSWLVAGLLLLALFINYIDRQTLSVLVPFLPPTLQMSNIVYGRIQSLFLLAYALAMPPNPAKQKSVAKAILRRVIVFVLREALIPPSG